MDAKHMLEEALSEWPLRKRVVRFARIFVPDDVAEDITQLTWEIMLERYPEELDSAPLAFTICKRKALDWLRHSKRVQFVEVATAETVADPRNELEAFELWETLKNELHHEELLVLVLSFQMEMSVPEIAEVISRPASTVYAVRKRALERARSILAE